MFTRLTELCEKAANGLYEENERKCLQDEVDQILDEIDRIGETTKFNEMLCLEVVILCLEKDLLQQMVQ